MNATLVDTNVLIDVLTGHPEWLPWSSDALERSATYGRLVINPVIYAEISIGFPNVEDCDAAFPSSDFVREEIPYQAAFLAGKAFLRYRRRGGRKLTPLPDLFIGAHAAIAGYRLLTRDPGRFRFYFPRLRLIAP